MTLHDRGVDRWLRQRKAWAGQEGKKASSIRKYPSRYLFKFTNRFKLESLFFAFHHTLAVFCGLIKPGGVFEKSLPLTNIQEPVTDLGMAVGFPKSVEPGDFDGILREGLVGEIMFLDSLFPGTTANARLFELFNIGVDALGIPKPERKTRNWRQFLGAIESPSAGVIRFPLLREGTYLSGENLRKLIKNGFVRKLRFACHNVSALQCGPDFPPSSGFPSNLETVTVPLAKPFAGEIDYEEGRD